MTVPMFPMKLLFISGSFSYPIRRRHLLNVSILLLMLSMKLSLILNFIVPFSYSKITRYVLLIDIG